jgi:hypothetical protein
MQRKTVFKLSLQIPGMAERRSYSPRGEEDGKGTMVLIGVLVVLIIIVGAGLLYVLQQKGGPGPVPPANETKPPPTNVTPPTNITPRCDDPCILRDAVSKKDPALCHTIASASIQQSCFEQISTDSMEACEAVLDGSKKQACVTSFAVAGGDITICDKLAGAAKTSCRSVVDPCADSSDRKLCLAMEASNPALCQNDKGCLLNYSLSKSDASSCGLIQDRVSATACKSTVLNSDKCYDLGIGSPRDYCYELFAIYSGEYLTCTQITTDSIYAVDCYSLYAAHEGNYTLCDSDGLDLNNRWTCYTNYSLITGDISGCSGIHDLATTNKFKCAFEFAKLHGNPSACELIGETSSKRTCYEGSILYSNTNLDWRNCAGVTNFEWRNKCYTEGAKMEKDITVCAYISEPFALESCRSSYGLNTTID